MLKSQTLRSAILACTCALSISAQAVGDPLRYVDVPAGELTLALENLARQAGVEFVYSAEQLKGLRTNGVQGELTAEKAVSMLIEGTELTLTRHASGALLIAPRRESASAPAAERIGVTKLAQGEAAVASTESSSSWGRPGAQVADTATTFSLEEIVVTAQRRAERLIDVPLSMSVLGADEVERRGLVSREDYLRSVPSVSVRDDGVGLAEIVIRGAYGDSFRTGPTVGLYFADVPLTGYAIGGSADIKLIDIQRVEVLRGPQGTLYGSNALSGAIRYLPTEPDLAGFGGSVNVGYSNTARHGGGNDAVSGVVNLPVVADKFAVRAVAYRHHNEGYVRNTAGDDPNLQAAAAASGASHLAVNKDHVGATEYLGGRFSALWRATDALDLSLIYMRVRDAQDGRLFELRKDGPYSRSDYQLGEVIGGSDDAQRIDLEILNLTAHYELPWGTLYSSTAWMEQEFIRKWDIGSFTSLFGTPQRPISQLSTTDAEVFTQELRFTSKLDGPFQVIAGLYYEDSQQPTQQPTFFAGSPANNPFAAVKLWQIDLERDVEQKAAYGQLSYEPIQWLKLTLGGRYFEYDSRFATRTFDTVILTPASSNTEAGESGETFKVGIELKPTGNALVYASLSQGFRLGRPLATEFIRSVCDRDGDGLLDGTNVSSTLNRVDSDRLDSYELGTKLGFMGGRGLFSAAVYQNDWTDIPITFVPPGCGTSLSINGGSARARGFEGELSFRLFDALKLALGVGYVDSELTATTSLGRDGDALNFTPEVNGNLGMELNFSLAQRAGFARVDYTYFGSYYTLTGHRGLRADAYDLINLRGGLAITENADFTIHIDNALNADDFTTVIGPGGFPPGYSVRLRPRTVGVGLSYRF